MALRYTIQGMAPGKKMTLTGSPVTVNTVGSTYTLDLIPSGGIGPYSYASIGTALPAWLTLNSTTGELSGIVQEGVTTGVIIEVTDVFGSKATKSFDVIGDPLSGTKQVELVGNPLYFSSPTTYSQEINQLESGATGVSSILTVVPGQKAAVICAIGCTGVQPDKIKYVRLVSSVGHVVEMQKVGITSSSFTGSRYAEISFWTTTGQNIPSGDLSVEYFYDPAGTFNAGRIYAWAQTLHYADNLQIGSLQIVGAQQIDSSGAIVSPSFAASATGRRLFGLVIGTETTSSTTPTDITLTGATKLKPTPIEASDSATWMQPFYVDRPNTSTYNITATFSTSQRFLLWAGIEVDLVADAPYGNVNNPAAPALVPPASLTTTPIGAGVYMNADTGNDTNDGLTAATAWKSLTRLQAWVDYGGTAPAGTTIYWHKSDDWYRKAPGDLVGRGFAPYAAIYLKGKALKCIAWGSANKLVKIGGDVAIPDGDWSAVGAGTGNAFTEANALKATVPWQATTDNFVCIGDYRLTPAMWAPNLTNLNTACPFLYAYRGENAQFSETVLSSEVHYGPTHNLAKRVSCAQADYSLGVDGILGTSDDIVGVLPIEYVIQLPGANTRYAAETPTGAVFRFVSNSTISSYVVIGAGGATMNLAGSPPTITFTTSDPGDDPQKPFPLNIAGWHRDIEQSRQYGYQPPGTGNRVVVAAFPAGATGVKSIQYFVDTMQIASLGYRQSDDFVFGRMRNYGLAIFDDYYAIGEVHCIQSLWLEYVNRGSQSIDFEGSHGYAKIGIMEECETGGGVRVSGSYVEIENGNLFMNDASSYRSAGSLTNQTKEHKFKNIIVRVHVGVHGNSQTAYESTSQIEIDGFAFMGVSRGPTMQTNSAAAPWLGKRLKWSRGFVMSARPVSTLDNPARTGGNALWRMDEDFDGCEIDRVVLWLPDSLGMFIDKKSGYSNGNSFIRRCVFQAASIHGAIGGSVTNTPNQKPLYIHDSYINDALGGGDANIVNCRIGPGMIFNGLKNGVFNMALDASMWELMTRDVFFGGYEPFMFGPDDILDGQPWLIPAQDEGFTTLRQIYLSTYEYLPNQQAGFTVAHLLGGEPGTQWVLPAGVGDNDSFGIDPYGVLYSKVNLTAATYEVWIGKTNTITAATLAAAPIGLTRYTNALGKFA